MSTPAPAEGPLLAEDLLLLLFDARNGTIAGEGTLFYTLAGAILAELALQRRVDVVDGPRLKGDQVRAIGGSAPGDALLRESWEKLAEKPQGVLAFLAGTGPLLREPLLDRLVGGGHVRREKRRFLGIIPTTALLDGGTPRRSELLGAVRPVLVDGAEADQRTVALAALLSASGCLPQLHRDIPWSGAVHARGKELEKGDWGAAAVNDAVTRTAIAVALSGLSGVTVINNPQ